MAAAWLSASALVLAIFMTDASVGSSLPLKAFLVSHREVPFDSTADKISSSTFSNLQYFDAVRRRVTKFRTPLPGTALAF